MKEGRRGAWKTEIPMRGANQSKMKGSISGNNNFAI